MSLPHDMPSHQLRFYVTTGYTCGYLPNKQAHSLIASPQYLIDAQVYSGLIQHGFRRSGKFAYRPHCENCIKCIPVRVVVQDFTSSRSQKRAYKQHQNLNAVILPVAFYEEHFALYTAYQDSRHPESRELKLDTEKIENHHQEAREQYQNFLCETNVDSVLVEFRENNHLKMVSLIDIVQDGISAVYTFYEISNAKFHIDNSNQDILSQDNLNNCDTKKHNSYGTYSVLWQIKWAEKFKLPYLYLGYWIKNSQKMNYKQNFKPLEKLIDGEWVK